MVDKNIPHSMTCHLLCGKIFMNFTKNKSCPSCHATVNTENSFTVRKPFVDAQSAPCSILIKPTCGNFLQDYKPGSDLHIGISDNSGNVLSYSKLGLTEETYGWNLALSVINNKQTNTDVEQWSLKLNQLCQDYSSWTRENYNSENFNCFDFVSTFLQRLKNVPFSTNLKEEVTTFYIRPCLIQALQFSVLYNSAKLNSSYLFTQ
ncbi:Uncharacterized protein T08_13601 [Trichinella sp. T8]|nr:Uncharacterized protein T08_13601 [Trichinella sp. T8]